MIKLQMSGPRDVVQNDDYAIHKSLLTSDLDYSPTFVLLIKIESHTFLFHLNYAFSSFPTHYSAYIQNFKRYLDGGANKEFF